jgi:hypothetical protein
VVHADIYETHDCSEKFIPTFEKFILQIVGEICRFVRKLFVPLVQQLGNRSKNWGGKTKKNPILFTFRKVAFFFGRFPMKDGREVGETDGSMVVRGGRGNSKEGMTL